MWRVQLLPVAGAELTTLPSDMQAHFLRIAELLEVHGPHRVGLPHVRPVTGKLWEIRMKGRDGHARAIYVTRTGQRLIVLHVFVKKTTKTPRKAIAIAEARMKELDQ